MGRRPCILPEGTSPSGLPFRCRLRGLRHPYIKNNKFNMFIMSEVIFTLYRTDEVTKKQHLSRNSRGAAFNHFC